MRPIIDISGAYCPMGCGQHLHLMPSGMIQCLGKECPRPDAVQKILSNPVTDDVVLFGSDSFTVLHPLKERLGDLWTCQVHTACTQLDGPPGLGQFRARFDENNGLVLERLEEDQHAQRD
jgi:hypothetical protein